MRLVHISDYNRHTMVLGKPVYDSKGRILLAEGRSVHPTILERFSFMGINYLFVEDATSKGITLDEMIDMPTWMDAILELKAIFEKATAKKPISIQPLQNIVHKLLNEIKLRQVIVLIPSSYSAADLRLYAHSLNVTILALQIGKRLGLNELSLRDLALGTLLHDIGKAVTEDEIRHPEEGFNILRKIIELNLISSHIALQHHELYDGTGFPRGISGNKIINYAQLCSIADFYEDLVYNYNLPPHEAMEMVMTKNGTSFEETIVQAFVHSIPSYPPGSIVKLNNDEKAIVTRIKVHMQRPDVRILSSGKEISLADNPTVIINGIV